MTLSEAISVLKDYERGVDSIEVKEALQTAIELMNDVNKGSVM